ncbi:MAG: glycosyltransferase family 2 protein [Candidatus Subteraquimicrobiales bacterium]|nr:glycosyltransferase family 2 protein [Candidatus Subteraquimicrobiales bacterium]
MRVSLIITTYNWKDALALVLKSALRQTRRPDEIIVADDGSSDGTGEMVREIDRQAPMSVHHSWQEDKGFRAARSRNRAIAAATGEYVILIDGDIIMERHFVEDHLAAARQGFFVQGGRVLLNERKTGEVLAGRDVGISFFAAGLANRQNHLRSRLLSRVLSSESYGLGGIKTCNLAFFRADALAINGFDEDFEGWGREDSDFAARLLNYGIRRLNLRFQAVAFHLHHPVQSRTRLGLNDEKLAGTIRTGKARCLNGIEQYLT